MKTKIGGTVILYNPESTVLHNINTFQSGIDLLIVVDNSPVQNTVLANQIKVSHPHTIYEWLGGNKGIAKALNLAGEIAIQHHCEWLLTMDQDSRFEEKKFEQFVDSIDEVTSVFQNVGVISPCHDVHEHIKSAMHVDFEPIHTAMTSGNLMNLRAFKTVSGFKNKLFIDFVDHEYCLRLRKNGFRIIQNNKILLQHSLGKFEMKTFLGKKIGISNHNYKRRYYITRNGLYTIANYLLFDFVFCFRVIMSIISDSIRILFFENYKLLKFKAIGLGFWHAMTNRYGEYK